METVLIPQADTLSVGWGWFQVLLQGTLPLHLLLMNAMVGGLGIGLALHLRGGAVHKRLAHRIMVMLSLVIAFVVNIGVAPLLFLQVLYGQFNYTSSVLMGAFWIQIIPMLIVAYYGSYLYDFQFKRLGKMGILVGSISLLLLLGIGALFTNNMLLMSLPQRFGEYFNHLDGTLLVLDHPEYLPRYLHMMLGAFAVGGLYVALLGRFRAIRDQEMAELATTVGMRVFLVTTIINVAVGLLYLLVLPKKNMMLFMGGDIGATIALLVGFLLTLGALIVAWKKKLWLTVGHVVALVYVMSFLRSWLRSEALREFFTLDQLQVVPQYSPMVFFIITLLVGIAALIWLAKKIAPAMAQEL